MNQSILFICTGNICRSPMAEGLFRKLRESGQGQFDVRSAGVATGGGQKPSAHTLDILNEEGIDLSKNRSQPLDRKLIDWASHVFTMSAGHLHTVQTMFPDAVEKTFLVTEFCANDLICGYDIPDPIGGDRNTYEHTHQLLTESLPSVIEFIQRTTHTNDLT